jgi:iron complex outermembrane receptor protein
LGTLPVGINFDNDQQRDELEFQQSLTGNEQWRAAWGGQLRRDAVRSSGLFGRTNWISNRLERVFASVEWRPDKRFLFHAGTTYEHSSLSGSSRSPRLSLTIFLAKGQSLRFGVSKARRAPVLFEEHANSGIAVPDVLTPFLAPYIGVLTANERTILYQQYLSSGNLNDEQILSRELAYQGSWPALRLSGEIRMFSDQVKDLIYLHRIEFPTLLLFIRRLSDPTAISTTADFRNMDRATVRGVEGSFRWAPWQGANLMVAATRTVIDSSDIDAQYSRSAPTHTASALFSQQLPWQTSFNLAYYRVGSMQWLGGGEPLPAFERVDIGIGKRFRWGQRSAELSWITQNVFNSNYPDFEQELRNKRISWLRCQYSF